jgi:hypothetical protein
MLAALSPKLGPIIVSCTKGIEHGSGKVMSEVIGECLPECRLAVLSGPNLALEIARRIPAASVIGSASQDILESVQQVLSVKGFRPYTSDDVMGIQLGGALKNIFAIAAGGVLTLYVAAPPNGSSVWVRVVDEVSGAVFEQEITADLPANTQFLSPRLFMNNGATAAAVAYDCSGVYVESDY